jgi:hypothetical protein
MAQATPMMRALGAVLAWSAAALGAVCIFGGLARIGLGWADTARVSHFCGDGREHGCLDGRPGRVVSISGPNVKVIWDDGARSETIEVRGDARPAPRAFVRVELWDGRAVSFTDRRGIQYRDDVFWPGGYPAFAFVLVTLGVLLIAPAAVGTRLRRGLPQ